MVTESVVIFVCKSVVKHPLAYVVRVSSSSHGLPPNRGVIGGD